MSVEMTMSEHSEELEMNIVENNVVDTEIDEEIVLSTKGTTDYTKLDNIPTFNGVPLVGDVMETDPTVPDWAKKSNKPDYNPEEIGAMNVDASIPISELASMFD